MPPKKSMMMPFHEDAPKIHPPKSKYSSKSTTSSFSSSSTAFVKAAPRRSPRLAPQLPTSHASSPEVSSDDDDDPMESALGEALQHQVGLILALRAFFDSQDRLDVHPLLNLPPLSDLDLPPAPFDALLLMSYEVMSRTLALEAALSCAQTEIVARTAPATRAVSPAPSLSLQPTSYSDSVAEDYCSLSSSSPPQSLLSCPPAQADNAAAPPATPAPPFAAATPPYVAPAPRYVDEVCYFLRRIEDRGASPTATLDEIQAFTASPPLVSATTAACLLRVAPFGTYTASFCREVLFLEAYYASRFERSDESWTQYLLDPVFLVELLMETVVEVQEYEAETLGDTRRIEELESQLAAALDEESSVRIEALKAQLAAASADATRREQAWRAHASEVARLAKEDAKLIQVLEASVQEWHTRALAEARHAEEGSARIEALKAQLAAVAEAAPPVAPAPHTAQELIAAASLVVAPPVVLDTLTQPPTPDGLEALGTGGPLSQRMTAVQPPTPVLLGTGGLSLQHTSVVQPRGTQGRLSRATPPVDTFEEESLARRFEEAIKYIRLLEESQFRSRSEAAYWHDEVTAYIRELEESLCRSRAETVVFRRGYLESEASAARLEAKLATKPSGAVLRVAAPAFVPATPVPSVPALLAPPSTVAAPSVQASPASTPAPIPVRRKPRRRRIKSRYKCGPPASDHPPLPLKTSPAPSIHKPPLHYYAPDFFVYCPMDKGRHSLTWVEALQCWSSPRLYSFPPILEVPSTPNPPSPSLVLCPPPPQLTIPSYSRAR